jgi:hypothetical protein
MISNLSSKHIIQVVPSSWGQKKAQDQPLASKVMAISGVSDGPFLL